MSGYIRLHRKITKWEWYDDANTLRVFIHILLNANHEKGKWHGHEIERGQWITSRKKLAKDLRLSERQVRTALEHLKSTNEITITPTNNYSLINIENYDIYQYKEKPSDQQADQSDDRQPTNYRPTTDQLPTTNNNDNNDNNKKNIYIVEQIIKYLNEKTGKHYKPATWSSLITGKLNKEYTPEDFYKVIDIKCSEWKGTDYEKYLRPQTLFSDRHFEDYLNSTPRKKSTGNPFLDILGELNEDTL